MTGPVRPACRRARSGDGAFDELRLNGVAPQTLTVFRFGPGGYGVALTATADEVVAAEPFDAMRLPVANLFADEPTEE